MAAPPVTAHVTPTGFKMPDGFKTVITFAANTGIQLWVETIKPPGYDGGDKIATTTMENLVVRTFDARKLRTYTDITFKAAYDPDVISPGLKGLVNNNNGVTVRFPDSSTWSFWGFLQKAEPDEHKEGEMPLMNCTVAITNWDPTAFVEADAVYTPAAGT